MGRKSGRKYYVNRNTKETSWKKPADFDAPLSGGGGDGSGAGKTLWKELTDKSSGRKYYVNRQTKETSWNKPADFDAPFKRSV